jgi:hypothetical protein
MLIGMRTTLILDDVLLMRAKQRAAEEQRTLSEVVNDALREHLNAAVRLREATAAYTAITYGDPSRPVAMEPADLAAADAAEDRARLGY